MRPLVAGLSGFRAAADSRWRYTPRLGMLLRRRAVRGFPNKASNAAIAYRERPSMDLWKTASTPFRNPCSFSSSGDSQYARDSSSRYSRGLVLNSFFSLRSLRSSRFLSSSDTICRRRASWSGDEFQRFLRFRLLFGFRGSGESDGAVLGFCGILKWP